MKKVRLELESIEILVKRNIWNLYFIVYTNHPTEPCKALVRLLPNTGTIQLTKKSENPYSFKPKQYGGHRLKVFQGEMNENKYVDIRLCMMQSRERLRNTAKIIADFKGQFNLEGLKEILSVSVLQWLVVDAGINAITDILSGIKDRNMGFISMDEEFEEEFKKNTVQLRSRTLSTGKAELKWVWEMKE